MSRTTVLAILLAATAIAPSIGTAREPHARLSVTRTRGGEVIASVKGTVRACGITATNDAPTFVVHGRVVEVSQPMAGVACMNPPPRSRPYRRSINLGKLPAGRYAVRWSFPELSIDYTVRAK
jgi:hypothetical protein